VPRFGPGVVAAAAIHVAALVWFAPSARSRERAVEHPAEIHSPSLAPPLDVVLIDEPAVSAPAVSDTRDVGTHVRRVKQTRQTSVLLSEATSASIVEPTEATVEPERQPSARSPPRVALQLPRGRWNALDRVPSGTDGQPAHPTSATPGPGYRSKTFSIDVSPDGSATIRDARNLQLAIQLPSRKDLGDALQSWYDSPKGEADPDALEQYDRPILAPVRSIGPTIARFDATDWLMRSHGEDPYASEKLKMLDATRDQRVEIGTRYRRDLLRSATLLVRDHLAQLWTTVTDPADRKRGLFELWDECADIGPDDVVIAGRAARAAIVRFIRAELPADSGHAYTRAELDQLNQQRQSRAAFAPYD
jgi:hypothetical protein